jgi:hypothetical protein
MAELEHDRTPDKTATQSLAFDGDRPLSGSAVVSIRISIGCGSDQTAGLMSDKLNPASCLAADLLTVSGGTLVFNQDKTLVVTFTTVPTAVIAARRLQWAFQGLSEAPPFAGVAAAIVVHSSEDLPASSMAGSISSCLERAVPGQILLGDSASRSMEDLPGLDLEAGAEPGLHALLWRRAESDSSPVAEEQALFAEFRRHGQANALNAQASADAGADESTAPGDLIHPRPDREVSPARMNPKWLILGGSAVALLGVAGVVAMVMHRHAPQTPPVPPQQKVDAPLMPATQAPTPSMSATNAPQAIPEPTHPTPSEPDPSKKRAKKQADEASSDSQPSASCDLGSAGIQRTLVRAENSLHGGRLDDARRDFQSVLACERNNARALEGLRRVKERREAPM